jgi:hypothetical protein
LTSRGSLATLQRKVASGDLTPLLAAVLALSLATKLAFARHFDGFLTGDDLEVVETALKYSSPAFDYTPWSLRNLFHPVVLVAPVLKVAGCFGNLTPELAAFLAAVPTAVLSTAAIALLFVLARRIGLSVAVALAAALLYAVHWIHWAYGGTQYPRPISTAFFLTAVLLTTAVRRRVLCDFLAGVLAAAACAVRFSEGVLIVPLLGFAWIRSREFRRIGAIVAGFGVGVVLLLGVFDELTWGAPFRSVSEFVRIMHGNELPPAGRGVKPWYHYGANALRWISPANVVLIAFGVRDRKTRVLLAIAAGIVALLSLSRYKTDRYLQAAIPFVAIAAAIGWDRIRTKSPALGVVVLVVTGAYGAVATVQLLAKKSQSAVAAARFIARMAPPPRTVALEQAWAYGERLYLRDVRIRDIPPHRPLDPDAVRESIDGADTAAFYVNDLGSDALRVLAESGMRSERTFQRPGGKPVVVFRRQTQSASDGAPLPPSRESSSPKS